MTIPQQIAKNLREVHTGGNWTAVNLKDTLAGITWQQATTPVYGFNTIATLVYHTHYYITVVTRVLQNEALNASDKESFVQLSFSSQQEWENYITTVLAGAESFAARVEQLPEARLAETFVHEKYGNYYRNLHGIIEHLHYHLGQITLIKKILQQEDKSLWEKP
jgi:uncharacterized damage-inducible protein DinB